jgi:hypothetical protein
MSDVSVRDNSLVANRLQAVQAEGCAVTALRLRACAAQCGERLPGLRLA